MITILSPAKNMKLHPEGTPPCSVPFFLSDVRAIQEVLRLYSPFDLQTLMSINEKLAADSFDRNLMMHFDENGTSAVETYDGIQYKYMDPHTFTSAEQQFAQEHLRILSGLYGVLRPYDSIYEYRLEMQTKLSVSGSKNLYAYWGSRLYEHLAPSPAIILNLASEEYAKCIRSHLRPEDRMVTCLFQVFHKGNWKVQATAAKMARGQMVRYLVQNRIDAPEDAAGFAVDGWKFVPDASTRETFVFQKQ